MQSPNGFRSLRLGYWVETSGQTCFPFPDVAYCGVDRLPADLDFADKVIAGKAFTAIDGVWDAYYEAELSGKLNVDLVLAQRLQHELAQFGIDVDIVYAEVVLVPADAATYPSGKLWLETLATVLLARADVHNILKARPGNLRFAGYDIAQPPAFHSAIYHSGLDTVRPDYVNHLNASGLFGSVNDAEEFLGAANGLAYGMLPFCLIGVWTPVT